MEVPIYNIWYKVHVRFEVRHLQSTTMSFLSRNLHDRVSEQLDVSQWLTNIYKPLHFDFKVVGEPGRP